MKKVNQTTFGEGKGNCFTACIASILEVPIESVPDFCVLYGDTEWWIRLEEWLSLRGLVPMEVCFDNGNYVDRQDIERRRLRAFYLRPDVPLILSGKNGVGINHSVVLYDGDKIHNPNPNQGSDLVSYRDVIAFVAEKPESSKS